MSKLQKKPSALKREHSGLQNVKFLIFFYFCWSFLLSWIRIRIPNPGLDTDPLTWLNLDPIRIRIRNTAFLATCSESIWLLPVTPLTYDQGSGIYMSSCFRCSPEQKAAVVKLIERHTGKRSAAIGIFTWHPIFLPFSAYIVFWTLNFFFLQEMAETTYLWYRQLAWESALWARRASRPAWQPTSQSLRLDPGQ
jgi:hypothetical protein